MEAMRGRKLACANCASGRDLRLAGTERYDPDRHDVAGFSGRLVRDRTYAYPRVHGTAT
jgi:hypothetical protein